jgi:hypothetical protein
MKNVTPKVVVLLLIVIAYLVLGGIAVYQTWTTPTTPTTGEGTEEAVQPQPPDFNDAYLFIVTGASGIMVSAFAVAMNIEHAPIQPRGTDAGDQSLVYVALTTVSDRFKKFLETLTPQNIATGYYVWAQVIMGVLCIVTWLARTEVTPTVVKNIATISATMFLAVATNVVNPEG